MNSHNDRVALIVAHPGHEGLLHGWLSKVHPLVFVLSDGSGGSGKSRVGYSRRLIEGAGARVGAVFGAAPDARWYQALLGKDVAFFIDCQMLIAHTAAAAGVGQLVCDPVELYNPLHDLANAMAHGIARLLEQRTRTPVPVWTFPILTAPQQVGRGEQEIRLTEAMIVQKQKASVDYTPLKAEAVQLAAMLRSEFERLYPEGVGYTWPQKTDRKPFYEEYGEARIRQGRYETLITYRDHVRPTALRLLEHACSLGEL